MVVTALQFGGTVSIPIVGVLAHAACTSAGVASPVPHNVVPAGGLGIVCIPELVEDADVVAPVTVDVTVVAPFVPLFVDALFADALFVDTEPPDPPTCPDVVVPAEVPHPIERQPT